MPIRLPLALAALALTLAPAAASAAPVKTFEVSIKGKHTVDWTYLSDGDTPECSTWSRGDGRHTVDFETAKPQRYTLQRMKLPGGDVHDMWLADGTHNATLGVARTGSWNYHVPPVTCSPCGPNSEFGECTDPLDRPTDSIACTRREIEGYVTAAYFGLGKHPEQGEDDLAPVDESIRIVASAPMPTSIGRCLPDVRGQKLAESDPLPVDFSARRLDTMKRGRAIEGGATRRLQMAFDKKTGRRKQTDDRCPAKRATGLTECATTTVEVRIRRVR